MGLIGKQIRKRGNQRLAEPMTATTALLIDEAVEAIKQLCEKHNQEESARLADKRTNGGWLARKVANAEKDSSYHLHLEVRQHEVLVSYQNSPQWILAKRKRNAGFAGYWLASITFPKGNGPAPRGERLISVRLLRWVIDGDGHLENQDKYAEVTDLLWEAVSAEAAG